MEYEKPQYKEKDASEMSSAMETRVSDSLQSEEVGQENNDDVDALNVGWVPVGGGSFSGQRNTQATVLRTCEVQQTVLRKEKVVADDRGSVEDRDGGAEKI